MDEFNIDLEQVNEQSPEFNDDSLEGSFYEFNGQDLEAQSVKEVGDSGTEANQEDEKPQRSENDDEKNQQTNEIEEKKNVGSNKADKSLSEALQKVTTTTASTTAATTAASAAAGTTAAGVISRIAGYMAAIVGAVVVAASAGIVEIFTKQAKFLDVIAESAYVSMQVEINEWSDNLAVRVTYGDKVDYVDTEYLKEEYEWRKQEAEMRGEETTGSSSEGFWLSYHFEGITEPTEATLELIGDKVLLNDVLDSRTITVYPEEKSEPEPLGAAVITQVSVFKDGDYYVYPELDVTEWAEGMRVKITNNGNVVYGDVLREEFQNEDDPEKIDVYYYCDVTFAEEKVEGNVFFVELLDANDNLLSSCEGVYIEAEPQAYAEITGVDVTKTESGEFYVEVRFTVYEYAEGMQLALLNDGVENMYVISQTDLGTPDESGYYVDSAKVIYFSDTTDYNFYIRIIDANGDTLSTYDAAYEEPAPVTYTVNFFVQGALEDSVEVTEGEKVSPVSVDIEGFELVCWSTSENEQTPFDFDTEVYEHYDLYAVLEPLTPEPQGSASVTFAEVAPDGDYYYVFAEISVDEWVDGMKIKVTNGSAEAVQDIVRNEEPELDDSENPTGNVIVSYDFDDITFEKSAVTDTTFVVEIIDANGTTLSSYPVTYVEPTPATYTVNFYVQGTLEDSFEVTEGERVSPVSVDVEGYEFICWSTSEEEEIAFDFDTEIYDDYDLYAVLESTTPPEPQGSASIVSASVVPDDDYYYVFAEISVDEWVEGMQIKVTNSGSEAIQNVIRNEEPELDDSDNPTGNVIVSYVFDDLALEKSAVFETIFHIELIDYNGTTLSSYEVEYDENNP